MRRLEGSSAVRQCRLRVLIAVVLGLPVVAGAITGSLSPAATVGVTNTNIVGTATPGATVTDTEIWPDGTTHGPFSTTANSSGNYTLGPFIVQQLGTYQATLKDSISGATITINYSGSGSFGGSVNTTSQTVTRGQSANYVLTINSGSGFAGTVNLAAFNWSQIPGATASWSSPSVSVPSNGSVQSTFTIQTSSSTSAGTYSNIKLQASNGSVAESVVTVQVPASILLDKSRRIV